MQLIAFAGIIEAQKATRTQRRSRSSTVIAGLATIYLFGKYRASARRRAILAHVEHPLSPQSM